MAKVLGPQSTQTRRWRFSVRLAVVLRKPPFAELVETNRIRCKWSLQGFYQRREQNCSPRAASKNATVREPGAVIEHYEKANVQHFSAAAAYYGEQNAIPFVAPSVMRNHLLDGAP
jgi:hypothetical protein